VVDNENSDVAEREPRTPGHPRPRERPLPPDVLGRRLAEVYRVVGPLYRRVFRAVEQATPVEGVTVGVRAVLERLTETRAETVPQMARAMALSRQFVQRMVNDARAAGYVDTARNPAHRRSPLVTLTAAGTDAIARVQEREHASLGEVGGDLTEAEVAATLRVLRHMLAALDDVDVD
jgi:DNA-binding MarR family transcriptional regulator